ncbi:amino acid deaminase [Aquincola sp. S2]|uniref:Amino acid deaminase n=1 Tax=Pseudaquabacterium terrae TaxID=2732868 RepID=A0ABX2EB05_9BURK|nr:amino acid deaminase [Aquabacterium terrae]NRF66290.1 amino acid deaminase [Aquabacterium terrae]
MNDVLDPLLDPTSKGYPASAPPLRRSQIGAQGWSVLDGDLPLPLAVIKRSALQHNLQWMQRFCDERGIGLAPHGKTSMSPQLFQRQLHAGAWGLTLATVGQARVAVEAGARRILIANQVLADADLRAIAALKTQHEGLRLLFLLDSIAQLELIEARQPATPFEVLLEVGLPGGRTGCRTTEAATELARRAHASPAVTLAGVECYEGLAAQGDDAQDRAFTDALMQRVTEIALLADRENLFDNDEVIVSAGGSAIFDLVVPGLKPQLTRKVSGLLRSGCYVTHDQGNYRRLVSLVNQRVGCSDAEGLQAAMEVWAVVQSLPEPGLAILAVGKRDISSDLGWPIPLQVIARGRRTLQPVPADWTISGLNDQHGYLRGELGSLAVGDRIVLGLSHPCTTFDKWRWMPIVDDAYRVIDAIVTCF